MGKSTYLKRYLNRIYSTLPPALQSVAATVNGYYLKFWRYSRETEELVAQYNQREYWTAGQWQNWRDDRLAHILRRAATQVPYYRNYWEQQRRAGNRASWEYLENWPILEKEPLRNDPRAFLAEDCDPRRMFHDNTSGTTGKSLDLWLSRQTTRAWYALYDARTRYWHGIDPAAHWAILGGQLVVPVTRTKPPYWVWNLAMRQLYLSSYHLSDAAIPAYLDALASFHIEYMIGFPSSISALARIQSEQGRSDLHIRSISTYGEQRLAHQKLAIDSAFQCDTRQTYGLAELVVGAGECPKGTLHLWPEVGIVEVVDDAGRAIPNGVTGNLIATGIFNPDQPLIRYNTGDRAALPSRPVQCACGRQLPALKSLDGRVEDVIFTRTGRRLGRMASIFKERRPVKDAQIVQETLDRIVVRYVPAADYTPEAGASIAQGVRSRVGDVEVILQGMAQIPREANGKFKLVVCKLSPEERARIGAA